MKTTKIFTTLIVLMISFLSFSQKPTYNYENEVLKVSHDNGARVKKEISFTLKKNSYDAINNSELFKNWKSKTFSDTNNRVYIQNHKDWDTVIMYVNSSIRMCLFSTKMKLKNSSSFDFIEGSVGIIYVNDKNEIVISSNFLAQNGYGNPVTSKVIYSIFMKEGKEETTCYVF